MKRIKKYVLPLLFIIFVAGVGYLFTSYGMTWYKTLKKPTEWLGSMVFVVVWSTIYSLFYIYCIRNEYNNKTLNLLLINGILNVLWCLMYFVINTLLGGLIVIIVNLFLAVYLVFEIYKYNKIYGYILSIYPLWIAIATTLNLATFILN